MGAPLLCDSRQQRGKHVAKNEWFKGHGIETVTVALPFGDYSRHGSNISIDTKQDVQELAANLGREHARFSRECDRARDAGYRLVVLVEEHAEYNDRDKVEGWRCRVCRACRKCDPLRTAKCKFRRYKPLNGPVLRKIMDKMERDHGVRFEFCKPSESAARICELLGMEVRDGPDR